MLLNALWRIVSVFKLVEKGMVQRTLRLLRCMLSSVYLLSSSDALKGTLSIPWA